MTASARLAMPGSSKSRLPMRAAAPCWRPLFRESRSASKLCTRWKSSASVRSSELFASCTCSRPIDNHGLATCGTARRRQLGERSLRRDHKRGARDRTSRSHLRRRSSPRQKRPAPAYLLRRRFAANEGGASSGRGHRQRRRSARHASGLMSARKFIERGRRILSVPEPASFFEHQDPRAQRWPLPRKPEQEERPRACARPSSRPPA